MGTSMGIDMDNVHVEMFDTGEIDIQIFIQEDFFFFSEEDEMAKKLKGVSRIPDEVVVRAITFIDEEGNVSHDIEPVYL